MVMDVSSYPPTSTPKLSTEHERNIHHCPAGLQGRVVTEPMLRLTGVGAVLQQVWTERKMPVCWPLCLLTGFSVIQCRACTQKGGKSEIRPSQESLQVLMMWEPECLHSEKDACSLEGTGSGGVGVPGRAHPSCCVQVML